MKIFSGSDRFAGSKRSAKGFVLFLAVSALSAGCSQKKDQSASAPAQTNAADSSQPAANAPAASQSTATPTAPTEPDLAAIDRAVRRWLVANRRPPKNFEDFAATAGVPIPPPPTGKKYILTPNMHVQLVDLK